MKLAWLLLLAGCPGKPDDSPSGDDTVVADDSEGPLCDSTSWEDTGVQVGTIQGACRCELPALVIGTGSEAYEPMEEGELLTMVHGPQGGWHMLTAVQMDNTRDVVEIAASVYDVASGVAVTSNLVYRVQLVPVEGCRYSFYNMYMYLSVDALAEGDRNTAPEVLSCHPLRIEMCARDTGGREVCGERTVTASPDPVDVEAGLATPCE